MYAAIDILRRFRARFPDLGQVPDSEVLGTSARMLQHSGILGLTSTDEIVDVLALRFSLTDEQIGSSFFGGVLRYVLSQQSWPLARRISFLRRHLVGRAVQPGDEELGKAIFGDA